MHAEDTAIDFTYAKTALFVRQTLAVTFGIPIEREITWAMLHRHICNPNNSALPKKIVFAGMSHLRIVLPEEAQMLASLLKDLRALRPDIKVLVILHD